MKKPTLRRSQIADYQKCAGCYEHKWILGAVVPSNPKMALGTVVDAIQNYNLSQKITSCVDMPVQEAIAMVDSEALQVKDRTSWDEEDTFEKMKATARDTVKFMIENVSPLIKPVAVQLAFEVETTLPFNISGTMDYVDVDGKIRDLKVTTPRGLAYYPHEFNLQTAAYWFAQQALTGKEPTSFVFDCICRKELKSGVTYSYEALEAPVSTDSIDYFWKCATAAYEGISKGVFMPSWAQHSLSCDGLCRTKRLAKAA